MTTTEVSAYVEQVLPLINDHPNESELLGLFQSQVIELLQDSYEDEGIARKANVIKKSRKLDEITQWQQDKLREIGQ